ncbi:MAG: hypothetical protein ACTH8J_08790 [Specibacter sp.]
MNPPTYFRDELGRHLDRHGAAALMKHDGVTHRISAAAGTIRAKCPRPVGAAL